MTHFKVSDEALEAACAALASAMEFEDRWPDDYTEDQRKTVRSAVVSCIKAAMPVMFEQVGFVRLYPTGVIVDFCGTDEMQSVEMWAYGVRDVYALKESK